MQSNIKILVAGLSQLEAGHSFQAHTHPYYQLNHIVRGEFVYTVDGVDYHAGVGDTVLVPMNSGHTIFLPGDSTGYFFEVKFSTLSQKDKDLCGDIGILVRGDDFSGVLLKEIFEENENLTPSSDEVMVTYLYSVLFKLTEKARREKHTPSKYIEVSSYSPPVRDTIRFLENNFSRQLTLDEIVEQTPVKKSHLCNLFKKETTITIFECLMIIRIRKAAELLTYTNMSLAQVSQETGFVNLTHFNRIFTKHLFLPPGQFRKHVESQDFYWRDLNAREKASPIAVAAFEGKKIDFAQK